MVTDAKPGYLPSYKPTLECKACDVKGETLFCLNRSRLEVAPSFSRASPNAGPTTRIRTAPTRGKNSTVGDHRATIILSVAHLHVTSRGVGFETAMWVAAPGS